MVINETSWFMELLTYNYNDSLIEVFDYDKTELLYVLSVKTNENDGIIIQNEGGMKFNLFRIPNEELKIDTTSVFEENLKKEFKERLEKFRN